LNGGLDIGSGAVGDIYRVAPARIVNTAATPAQCTL
jgi:hypothetical protein